MEVFYFDIWHPASARNASTFYQTFSHIHSVEGLRLLHVIDYFSAVITIHKAQVI